MESLVVAALFLDILGGDPPRIPHPVVMIGWLANRGEGMIRRLFLSSGGLKAAGIMAVIVLAGGSYLLVAVLLEWCFHFSYYLGWAASVLLIYQALAIKSLARHALKVLDALKKGNLERARHLVGLIVARDTHHLSEEEVSRAAVESVAESTLDGIVAPLFYSFLGGPPLVWAYKALNTMDSMWGYKTPRYRDLGWGAAKLDDAINFIPARLIGVFFLFLAPWTRGGLKRTAQAIFRDAPRHNSPNSGIPEAAMAGALSVQLGGTSFYEGKASSKVLMGWGKELVGSNHILTAVKLMYGVTFLTAAVGGLVGWYFL